MKKQIRTVNEEKGIVQITTVSERWYSRISSATNNYEFVPSVTWIAEHYPKGIGFYKWLANKGWDEAEAIKEAAGDKGSKVHQAICDLIDGKEVLMSAKYVSPSTDQEEELTLEEYECLMAFTNWFKATKPEVEQNGLVVWNSKENYAGTLDFICRIEGQLYIVDFKTSQNIYPSHEIQLSAYAATFDNPQEFKLAILQLGYWRNKNKYRFVEIPYQFDLFLAAKKIWQKETEGIAPLQKDYPVKLQL